MWGLVRGVLKPVRKMTDFPVINEFNSRKNEPKYQNEQSRTVPSFIPESDSLRCFLYAQEYEFGVTMNKRFNKYELNVLKYSKSYRYLSLVYIAVNAIGIFFAIYFLLLFPESTHESRHINIIRLNAMVIMLGMSYLMYTCIRTIEKYKLHYDSEQDVCNE